MYKHDLPLSKPQRLVGFMAHQTISIDKTTPRLGVSWASGEPMSTRIEFYSVCACVSIYLSREREREGGRERETHTHRQRGDVGKQDLGR